jgi:hypothetical protein
MLMILSRILNRLTQKVVLTNLSVGGADGCFEEGDFALSD